MAILGGLDRRNPIRRGIGRGARDPGIGTRRRGAGRGTHGSQAPASTRTRTSRQRHARRRGAGDRRSAPGQPTRRRAATGGAEGLRDAGRRTLQPHRRSPGAVQDGRLRSHVDVDGGRTDPGVRPAAAASHVCRALRVAPRRLAERGRSRGPMQQSVVRAHVDVAEERPARALAAQPSIHHRLRSRAAVATVRCVHEGRARARRHRGRLSCRRLPAHVDVVPRRADEASRVAAPRTAARPRACGRS